MKRLHGATLVLLALAVAGCGREAPPAEPAEPGPAQPAAAPAHAGGKGKQAKFEYETVCANPDVEVPSGFRGDVHPALFGQERLELTAHWKPTLMESKRKGIKLGVIDGASAPEYSIPDELVALLTESTPAHEHASYGGHELSAFLPPELGEPGQMWKIDLDQAEAFLQQFHPQTSMHFDRYRQPYGRRPGPPGAFGILRALTPDYADVVFRVHAEFVLSEGAALYTPACFLGRMLVDRAAGRVAYFQMRVPTDRPVKVNLTLTFKLPEPPRNKVTNIVFEHVEPMELVGGEAERLPSVEAPDALALDDAHEQLKHAFYKFMDIGWVPAEEMLALAQKQDKPIFIVVLTSPLDDQSC